jgi:hypothetical protein
MAKPTVTLREIRQQVNLAQSELEALMVMLCEEELPLLAKHMFSSDEIDQMNRVLVILKSKERGRH